MTTTCERCRATLPAGVGQCIECGAIIASPVTIAKPAEDERPPAPAAPIELPAIKSGQAVRSTGGDALTTLTIALVCAVGGGLGGLMIATRWEVESTLFSLGLTLAGGISGGVYGHRYASGR